ncbi:hypothetical protein [Sphingopyxis panaciterrae]
MSVARLNLQNASLIVRHRLFTMIAANRAAYTQNGLARVQVVLDRKAVIRTGLKCHHRLMAVEMILRSGDLLAILAALMLAACGVRHADGSPAEPEPGAPVYGSATALRGFYSTGFEKSAFAPCKSGKELCKIPVSWKDPFKGFCWVVFTPQGAASMRSLRANNPMADDRMIWLESEGRLAIKPGPFGHLGSYQCQVEFGHVRVLDSNILPNVRGEISANEK